MSVSVTGSVKIYRTVASLKYTAGQAQVHHRYTPPTTPNATPLCMRRKLCEGLVEARSKKTYRLSILRTHLQKAHKQKIIMPAANIPKVIVSLLF